MQPSPSITKGSSTVSRQAFSLVELLVAMAVLSLIVVILAQMINHVTGAWQRGEANKEKLQNIRALADFMGSELQAAMLPINRPSQTSLQFLINPSSVTTTNRNHDALFWQMPLATDSSQGDVAEVGYFVKWDTTTTPANPRSLLCRYYVSPTDTANYLIYSAPTAWVSDTLIGTVAPASATNNYQGLFAKNVLGLWVTPLNSAGALIATPFDSRSGPSLPAMIDLGLVMIDARMASRITPSMKTTITSLVTAAAATNAQSFYTTALASPGLQAIRSGLHYYQTRINLMNSQ